MAVPYRAGRCILGCGRSVATHTKTNICKTCLGNLAMCRGKTAAARLRYRETLTVRSNRQEEIDKFPKGYKPTNGRYVKNAKERRYERETASAG